MYLTLFTLTILSSYCGLSQAILCYVCESYTDFRCLDPYDHRAFPQVDCSSAIYARDKPPVFCQKRTEVVDGSYVTTRGCSVDFRWEDVQGYRDIVGGRVPCIRRSGKETCLCSTDGCNSATRLPISAVCLTLVILARLF